MQASNFYDFKLTNILELCTVAIGALALYIQKRKDTARLAKDRENEISQQTRMHTENKERLDVLLEFKKDQDKLNDKRDAAINVITNLLATQTELARGMNRRLEFVENMVLKK